ncbi:Histone_H3 [Hexamita inflata]|uniref:Histone H3 n=1 Tax=Hexamita inflata TaxID=28002 RepID=A0AA86TUR6_9EUKA|nr:Histone H3 [Hexamita inflata]
MLIKLSSQQRNGMRGPRKSIFTRKIVRRSQAQRKRHVIETKLLQRQTSYAIPKSSFVQLVRLLSTRFGPDFRFQSLALEILQEAAEHFLVQMFVDAVLLAEHAKRVTVFDRDVNLWLRLMRFKWAM